jgi:hypothetical protein
MDSQRTASLFQQIGTHWLFVTEINPSVKSQSFIREKCGESPATVNGMWNQNWSVQLGLADGDDWMIIGTQWKDWSRVAPQSIFIDKIDNIAPAVERQWGQNRRIVTTIYNRQHWILLSEAMVGDDIVGQQIVKTAHWPGDEIQQLWAQGKRIQSIFGGPQDWTIVAEQLIGLAPSQLVQAGPNPDAFEFQDHLSSGYKLIGATFQSSSNIYSFLWEVAPTSFSINQEIYFKKEFPDALITKLGLSVENR